MLIYKLILEGKTTIKIGHTSYNETIYRMVYHAQHGYIEINDKFIVPIHRVTLMIKEEVQ